MSRHYGVSFIFSCHESTIDGVIIDYEEQIRLVEASNVDEALTKSLSIGRSNELDYDAASGLHVFWRFRGVCKIFEIFDEVLVDGSEIFSRYLGTDNINDPIYKFIDVVKNTEQKETS